MPPKIRELEARLLVAGFICRGGKGSHRNYTHPLLKRVVTISGRAGADAERYQERQIDQAIREVEELEAKNEIR